jgi:hypothetical protein
LRNLFAKTTYIALIVLCVLLSSASAISTEQRKILEQSGNDYFNNHAAIEHATVTVNDDNTINVWIAPLGGEASGVWVLQSIGAIANWYPTAYHVFPDIGVLYFTLEGKDIGKQSGKALPEWAAMVRWNGDYPNDLPNDDDLLDLALKITENTKES